ncbi:MAG: hypothetical protein WAV05_19865 [Anaerolineales bacterium]
MSSSIAGVPNWVISSRQSLMGCGDQGESTRKMGAGKERSPCLHPFFERSPLPRWL